MDWLAFSFPNQPGFLDSFNPSTNHGGAVEHGEEEGSGGGSSSDLALAGPKLENFLGGCVDVNLYDGCGDGAMHDSNHKSSIAGGLLCDYPSGHLESDGSKAVVVQTEPKKTADTFGQRTSIYRGVTRHRWTGRYEAHLWDNSCRREGQSRKGRQVYLGGYDKETKAARAYDLAAIKYWGLTTTTNFPVPNYEKEIEEMKNMTRQEFVASLRRKSSGFSRGASMYRGVTRHHQHGRWQARIGRVAGNKDLYLGTFSSQEEAAEAYDIAAIKFRGLNAVTNFDMSRYDVKCIAKSNLPIGGMSGRTSNSKSVVLSCPPDQSPSSSDTKGRSVDLAYGFAMRQRQRQRQRQQQKQQQQHEYWSFLALNQQTIQQGCNYGIDDNPYLNVFPSGANMDFYTGVTATADAEGKNGSYMWNGSAGGDDAYTMQHSREQTQSAQRDNEEEQEKTNPNSGSSTIPYATPTALGTGFENETGYGDSTGTWVTLQPSSNHAYPQTATKANMVVFQTPIFGMK